MAEPKQIPASELTAYQLRVIKAFAAGDRHHLRTVAMLARSGYFRRGPGGRYHLTSKGTPSHV